MNKKTKILKEIIKSEGGKALKRAAQVFFFMGAVKFFGWAMEKILGKIKSIKEDHGLCDDEDYDFRNAECYA